MNKAIIGGIMFLLALALPAGSAGMVALPDDVVRVYDENGELIWEQMTEPSNPLLLKTVHYFRLSALEQDDSEAKPGGGGSIGTDCTATGHRLTGWYWDRPYSAKAASYASQASSAGGEWDRWTGASIFGGIQSGKSGEAGTYDGVNQLEWESLGASSTVAVTTTWSYRGSGLAVESDGQYNTYYKWSTSGATDSMDVQGVATHEIGHTFGLDHPQGSCLTMYAYVNYGQTHQRTLGDGDVLGIRAIYGA